MNIDFVNILGVVAFVAALLISVMIHEFGHFITARKFGMRVSEFFVGFGKRIWSITRGETEYGIKAIPAGGYCRIEGMTPTDEMPDAQENRAFWRASSWKKLIVLGAGSFAHFLIGFILLFTVFAGTGYTDYPPTINKVEAGSPAASAGLLAGDRVISIDGKALESWTEGIDQIANSQGKALAFLVERNGKEVTLFATGEYIAEEKRYRVGIYPGVEREFKRDSIGTALDKSASNVGILFKASLTSLKDLPEKVPQLFRQTFLGEERDPEGLVGVVGAARVSGEVVSLDRANANERLTTFIFLVASLNIFVGIFNLLPILPLDGGHMAVAIADEFRALFARLRKRPRPAPINVNVLTPVTAVVVVALGFLTILLVLADIINPISLN